jgi:DNA adenine methylase
MKYMGSKNRHANELLPIILSNAIYSQTYIEPFCGGCNMIDKVPLKNRIANDSHYYLICLFKAIVNGWIPPEYIKILD